jgi:hypothetical protein
MRLLSSLLSTKRFPLDTRCAENVFMEGRSSKLWPCAKTPRTIRNKYRPIEAALYRAEEPLTREHKPAAVTRLDGVR